MRFLKIALLIILTETLYAQNWTEQSFGTKDIFALQFFNSNQGYIYSDGFYKTTNGGTNWTKISSTNLKYFSSVYDMKFFDQYNGWLAGTNYTTNFIFRTTNGGIDWSSGYIGAYASTISSMCFVSASRGWAVGKLIWKTTDGTNWTSVSLPSGIQSLSSVYFVDTNNGWAVGSYGKVIHTTDGGISWNEQVSGENASMNSVFFTDVNNGWAVCDNGKIIHTSNGGSTWTGQISGGTWKLNKVQFLNTQKGWIVGDNGVVLYTNDGGNNWIKEVGGSTGYSLTKLSFINENTGWVAGVSGTIYKREYQNVPSTISVKVPASGVTWKSGSREVVTWSSSNVTGNVSIKLSTDGGVTYPITLSSNISNYGIDSITVPNNPSLSCRIKVESVSDPSVFGVNGGDFTIANPPSVTVYSPNGGENWKIGESHNITWTSQNVNNLKIEYTYNNGISWNTIAGSIPASSGSYTWIIPATQSGQCKVRLSDINNSSVKAISNNVFSISIVDVASNWIIYNTSNSGMPNNVAWSVTLDKYRNKWIGTDGGGIASFNGINWTVYNSTNSGLPSNWISSIMVDSTDTKWISTWFSGAASFDGTNWKTFNTSNSGIPHNAVISAVADASNNKWFCTLGGGVAKYDGVTWSILKTSNSGLPNDSLRVMAIDNQGIKWFGSGGLAKYNGTSWAIYDTANSGLPHQYIFAILVDKMNNKWIGTWGGGLAKFDGVNWTVYNISNSLLPSNYIYSIAEDAAGTKWIGTAQGLAKFDGQNWIVYDETNSSLPQNYVHSVKVDDFGNKWIATHNGAAAFREGGVIDLRVISPNKGESWKVNESHSITWTSKNIANVKIEYSNDNGISWTTITSSVPASAGTFNWLVPYSVSANCKIRISDVSNPAVCDLSDSQFSILWPVMSITEARKQTLGTKVKVGGVIISPNFHVNKNSFYISDHKAGVDIFGGTKPSTAYSLGDSVVVTGWLYDYSGLLEVSDSSGTTNTLVIEKISSGNPVPLPVDVSIAELNLNGERYEGSLIRIKNLTKTPQSKPWPSTNASVTMSFTALGTSGVTDTLSLRVTYPSEMIASQEPQWPKTITGIASQFTTTGTGGYQLTPRFLSDFTQSQSLLSLTSPNGGEVWKAGGTYNIKWTSSGINALQLEYTTDGGQSWTIAVSNISASSGSYSWTVPNNIQSSQCKIKLSDYSNAQTYVISNAFTIQWLPVSIPDARKMAYGTKVKVGGVIISPNFHVNKNSFYISDHKAGVDIFGGTKPSTAYSLGDSVVVTGWLYDYSGLLEVSDSSGTTNTLTIEKVSSGNALPEPIELTISQLNTNGESYEGSLIRIKNLVKSTASNPWPTSPASVTMKFVLQASAGTQTDTLQMRITNPSEMIGSSEPLWPGNVTGIATQYKTSGSDNYQLTPRFLSDFAQSDPSDPYLVTTDATNIATASATLNGIINSNNSQYTVSFEYGTTTGYGTVINALQSPVSGAANVNVSANINNLTSNTTYHFRIKAENTRGIFYSNDQIFKTVAAKTLTLKSPVSGDKWISYSYHSITWTSQNIDNVKIEYSTNNGAEWKIIAESVQASSGSYSWMIPYVESSLCKIRISDASDPSVYAVNYQNFTISPPVGQITVVSPAGGEEMISSLHFTIEWTSSNIQSVNIDISTDNGYSWSSVAKNIAAPLNYYYWNIPGEINSGVCKIRISDSGNSSIQSISSGTFGITNYSPLVDHSGKTYTFVDASKSSSYKLVGLPGLSSGLSLSQFAQGEVKKDWTAFYDNGTSHDYLKEYDGSDLFYFAPGKGFWVLSKNTISLKGQVLSVPLANDGSYSIQIHPGWNVISNPFSVPIDWTSVLAANNLFANQVIYEWNESGWVKPQSMQPYKGYYFNSLSMDNTMLKIPYKSNSNSSKVVLLKTPDSLQTVPINENNISIKLIDEEGKVRSNVVIGTDHNSLDDYDEHDFMAPPGNFEEAGLRIINPNLSMNWKELFIEHRKQIGEGQRFRVDYKNNTGKALMLSCDGIENFNEYEVYLVDNRLKQFHNLKKEKIVLLPSFVQNGTVEMLIGNEKFIDQKKSELIPNEFSLYQNYPNPFNPVTIIRFSIPEDAFVNLKVYDITGKMIKELENGNEEAGEHELIFNASDIASGVYLYKIEAKGRSGKSYSQSKKLSVLR